MSREMRHFVAIERRMRVEMHQLRREMRQCAANVQMCKKCANVQENDVQKMIKCARKCANVQKMCKCARNVRRNV